MGLLLKVRPDRQFVPVKRCGRFKVTCDEAASRGHMLAKLKAMQEQLIVDCDKRDGLEFWDKYGFEVRGPLDHIEFSADDTPDLGPAAMPDPRDLAEMEHWRKAEETRMALNAGEDIDYVDFEVVGVFKRPVQGGLVVI